MIEIDLYILKSSIEFSIFVANYSERGGAKVSWLMRVLVTGYTLALDLESTKLEQNMFKIWSLGMICVSGCKRMKLLIT